MSWVELFFYLFLSYLLIQLVRLLLADADLTLLWKEKFGLKPDCLQGQVVWITGASSGIGEHLAYDLARAGCKLVLSARRHEELQRVKKQCLVSSQVKEEDILVLPLDMLKTDTHAEAMEKVISHFKQIDILVNNAGRSQRSWVLTTDLEVHKEMLALNVVAVISLTKTVLPHMVKRKSGQIVVTSSLSGKMGVPFSACYSASKHAVQGYFDALRIEMSRDNIAVTCLCPGQIKTGVIYNSFVAEKGKSYGQHSSSASEKRMAAERCTELMTIAIANKVNEAWIAKQPELLFTYAAQYMPEVSKWVAKKVGLKLLEKLRDKTPTPTS